MAYAERVGRRVLVARFEPVVPPISVTMIPSFDFYINAENELARLVGALREDEPVSPPPRRPEPRSPEPQDNGPAPHPGESPRSLSGDSREGPERGPRHRVGVIVLACGIFAAAIAAWMMLPTPGTSHPPPGTAATTHAATCTSKAISGSIPISTPPAAPTPAPGTSLSGPLTGSLAATLPGPDTAPVQSVAFGPGSTTLAVGDSDGETNLWDLSTVKV